ncbi:MAG TPA: hypothetical protein VFC94_00870 [Bacteroidaceae bacterium]|nr:hypothetical protein [Bacteroidaceae bacterium]
MKTKAIIFTLLSAIMLGVTTSCEDMLSTESSMVMFEEDNVLNQATDTVYSVMGIIQKIQVIADRTVLFGELRGELTELTEFASADMRAISEFSVSIDNQYNRPADYYAVINNCNYFLANADTSYQKNAQYVFKREYAAVMAFRAWAYLQLAQTYGKVPFVIEPITSGDKAIPDLYPILDIKNIAINLIADLEPMIDLAPPLYGGIGSYNSEDFFIPVRLILGDLCLWAGEGYYEKAAQYYHDYVSSLNRNLPTGVSRVAWRSKDFDNVGDSYVSSFGTEREDQQICFIPMEREHYAGVVSELENIFCSTEENYNFYKATRSRALTELAANQKHCYVYVNPDIYARDTLYVNADTVSNALLKGDLRLYSIFELKTTKSLETSMFYENQQRIRKINPQEVVMYRIDQVYLRYAEALNRAGMPESAFAILKYGLCTTNINRYISPEEIAKATPLGLLSFNVNLFTPADISSTSGQITGNTMGIHSRGSGDAKANKYYSMPMPDTTAVEYMSLTDSLEKAEYIRNFQIIKVEEMIADEMALETAFEGFRFGDLIRISLHRGEDKGVYSDNAYLATKVATRKGAANYDSALETLLKGDGTSYNPKWYLPLP